jgi:hypothetical protein
VAAQQALTPTVIRGVRWKYALAVLGGIMFVTLGVWIGAQGGVEAAVIGWVAVLVFGPMTVLGVGQVIRPAELTLHADRFELRAGFRQPTQVAWADVDEFFVWSHRGTRLVAWRCKSGREPKGGLAAMNRALGLDGGLPTGWPVKPERLLEVMEEWRRRAVSA